MHKEFCMQGICPNCGAAGEVGGACGEKNCKLHGYYFIYEDKGRKQLSAGLERDALVGRKVDEYLVVDRLGEGGFGVVYLTLQMPIMMETALKLLKSSTLQEGDAARRLDKFKQEAQALARLTHPNIVRLIKYGIFESVPYMVMEFVKGAMELRHEMKARLAAGSRFSVAEIRHIWTQVLNALTAAHEDGLIHRDMKPENIMLQEVKGDVHFVRVLDFGLAKFLADSPQTSLIQGTPIYMAPEQFLGRDIGPWTDLYSIGLLLSEILTGRTVFDAVDTTVLFRNKMNPGFDPGCIAVDVGLPGASVQFIRKACAMDTSVRFRSAPEFLEAMNEMLGRLIDPAMARTEPAIPAISSTQMVASDSIESGSDFLDSDLTPGQERRSDAASDAAIANAPTVASDSLKPKPGGGWRSKAGTIVGVATALLVLVAAALGLFTGIFIDGDEEGADAGQVAEAPQDVRSEGPAVPLPDAVAGLPDIRIKRDLPKARARDLVRREAHKVRKPRVDVKPQARDIAATRPDTARQRPDVVGSKPDVAAQKGDVAAPKTDVSGEKQDVAAQKTDAVRPLGDAAVRPHDVKPEVAVGTVREQLNALYIEEGVPVPSEKCRVVEPAAVEKLMAAYRSLSGPEDAMGEAARQLAALEAQMAGSAEYWVVSARLQRKLNRKEPEAMLNPAKKAVELCPEMAVAWNVLGTAHLSAQESLKAEEMYARAMELSPDYMQPRFNMALLAIKKGELPVALGLLDELIEKRPNHRKAHWIRARIRLASGQFEPAVGDLQVVLEREPGNTQALIQLGHARMELGKNSEAQEAYCKALALGDENAEKHCKKKE